MLGTMLAGASSTYQGFCQIPVCSPRFLAPGVQPRRSWGAAGSTSHLMGVRIKLCLPNDGARVLGGGGSDISCDPLHPKAERQSALCPRWVSRMSTSRPRSTRSLTKHVYGASSPARTESLERERRTWPCSLDTPFSHSLHLP